MKVVITNTSIIIFLLIMLLMALIMQLRVTVFMINKVPILYKNKVIMN